MGMSFSSSSSRPQQPPGLTAFCNSIFDCADDQTAIKFMRMAPAVFPQFISSSSIQQSKHKHNQPINNHNHNNNKQKQSTLTVRAPITSSTHSPFSSASSSNIRSVPHETDTDTTNETVIPMQQYAYSQDDIKAAQQLLNIHSFLSATTAQPRNNAKIKKKQIRRKHPRNFKKMNECHSMDKVIDINSFQLAMDDLHCMDENFQLYSKNIRALNSKFKCSFDDCFACFEEKISFKQHMESQHAMHLCIKCDQMYASKQELDTHQCKRAKKKKRKRKYCKKEQTSFRCKICNKSFLSKGSLSKHQAVHDGQKRFYCKYCNKGYLQQWRHKKHQAQCAAMH